MRNELRNILWFGLLLGNLTLAILFGWHQARSAPTAAATAEIIEQGRQVYADQCASCHGAQLEGQPDWKTPLPSGRLPAPPHDAGGHTWHHADEILFRIIKEGTAAIVGNGYESDMPGFADFLSDAEIRAVLAYIKSTWPKRERTYQENVSQPR
ncbi:c-type cytochrome [Paracoccus simplex]|uniref:C-type cytochrome n=1 Tax=Paracoccus simplex TaxID=2086346 RepID=A0ABV7S4G2_9RHOB